MRATESWPVLEGRPLAFLLCPAVPPPAAMALSVHWNWRALKVRKTASLKRARSPETTPGG